MKSISVHRYSYRTKRGHFSPARYNTCTYCVICYDGKQKSRIAQGVFGTYKKTIEAIKKKYNNKFGDCTYNIDYSKPMVIYG